jgi:hypothetical protein
MMRRWILNGVELVISISRYILKLNLAKTRSVQQYITRNYWIFGLCPSSGILNNTTFWKQHVSVFRWKGGDTFSVRSIKRDNLNHCITCVGSGNLLRAVTSTVILGSESSRAHDHILPSQRLWGSCNSAATYVNVITTIYGPEIRFCQWHITGKFTIKIVEKHIKTWN